MSKDVIKELFLVLNIKSAKDKIVYNYQIEYTYIPKSQNILPRQRVLKFNNGKLERKIFVNGNIDLINFLNNEIKIYN